MSAIKFFKRRQDAIAYIGGRYAMGMLFEEEKEADDPGRSFVVGSYEAYLRRYTDSSARRTHEYIFDDPSLAIKLFFDLEMKDITSDAEIAKFRSEMHFVVERTKRLLLEKWRIVAGEPLVLDASREGKESVHVVFDRVVFENVFEVGRFVEENFGDSKIIDVHMYDGRQTLRIPYSVGNGKRVALCPVVNGRRTTAYDPHVVRRALLHNVASSDEASIHRVPPTGAMSKRRRMNDLDAAVTHSWITREKFETMRRALEEWAEEMHYTVHSVELTTVSEPGSAGTLPPVPQIHAILSNVCCIVKGAPHELNKTYIHITLPRVVMAYPFLSLASPSVFVCADKSDCANATWPGPNFASLFFNSEMASLYVRATEATSSSSRSGERRPE